MIYPILFLIPARVGSKGLPGKNIKEVAGIPLVGRAIQNALMAAKSIPGNGHRIVCSTDDSYIGSIAHKWGAEVPFIRPAKLATPRATSVGVALHAIDWYSKQGQRFGIFTLLQPTSPLTEPSDIVNSIKLFLKGDGSSVATVARSHPPFWTYQLRSGRLHGLVVQTKRVTRRQDVSSCYSRNGAVYVATSAWLKRTKSFIVPGQTYGSIMPPERSIDVDHAEDLTLAEAWLKARSPAAFRVGKLSVGRGAPCFMIAEAGVNHNGDPEIAHRLIDVAADSGADAVKFQTFDPSALTAPDAKLAPYQQQNVEHAGPQKELLEKLVMSEPLHYELKQHAEERNLIFLSTPFEERSADFLGQLGLHAFKIPSGEVTNHPFLAHVARKKKPILLSTGMADMLAVAQAVRVIRENGNPPLALFHCVSNYPADIHHANLKSMETMRAAFNVPVGWSDHTLGWEATLAAVALGAAMIEKHFTLDRSLPGPDHKASLEPQELQEMVRQLRDVESALGSGIKLPVGSEKSTADVARKSLHWRVSVKAGTVLEEKHFIALRPGIGRPPSELSRLVGQRLAANVVAGTMVREKDVESSSRRRRRK